jgi:hypothetical protein
MLDVLKRKAIAVNEKRTIAKARRLEIGFDAARRASIESRDRRPLGEPDDGF